MELFKRILKVTFIITLFFPDILVLSKNKYSLNESSKDSLINQKFENYSEADNIKTDYLLGSGDGIRINFSGIDIYSGIYIIDPDGFLNLPEIGKVFCIRKTLAELNDILQKQYEEYIIEPKLDLKIVSYRPQNVYIKGEVKRPGLYSLKYVNLSLESGNKKNQTNKTNLEDVFIAPRIFDALKLSKGFTNYANLSNIQIIRENSESQGGGKIETRLNFLSLIEEGNQAINIKIMDGDIIVIPKTNKFIKEQIIAINKSNLSPDQVSIYISGNVLNPGSFFINQGSSLVQAIYKAGGEQYFTGTVQHIRFNDSGKVEKSTFKFNPNAPFNSKQNPIVLDGDIININKTDFGKSLDFLKEVANPVVTTYGIISIFE